MRCADPDHRCRARRTPTALRHCAEARGPRPRWRPRAARAARRPPRARGSCVGGRRRCKLIDPLRRQPLLRLPRGNPPRHFRGLHQGTGERKKKKNERKKEQGCGFSFFFLVLNEINLPWPMCRCVCRSTVTAAPRALAFLRFVFFVFFFFKNIRQAETWKSKLITMDHLRFLMNLFAFFLSFLSFFFLSFLSFHFFHSFIFFLSLVWLCGRGDCGDGEAQRHGDYGPCCADRL